MTKPLPNPDRQTLGKFKDLEERIQEIEERKFLVALDNYIDARIHFETCPDNQEIIERRDREVGAAREYMKLLLDRFVNEIIKEVSGNGK